MLYRTWLAGALAWAAASAPAGARADASAKTASKGEVARVEAKPNGRALPLALEGLRWGMTRGQLEECADRQIDADFAPARKAALSTPARRDLEAKVAAHKAAFRRSYVELSEGPDGFDTSPLVGEFSKGNGEALMRLPTAAGGKVWFFLIGDRLWKTYEEVPPGATPGAALGEALKRAQASAGGRVPRLVPAAPAKGRPVAVHELEDGATHLRLWERGAGVVALVHEERAMVARLPAVRKKVARAPAPDEGLSPQVSAVLRAGGAGKKGGASRGGP